MDKNALFIIRTAIIFAAAAGTIGWHDINAVSPYILALLVFALNAQLRVTVLKGNWHLASLFLDLGLVFFIQTELGGANYLLLSISVIDGLLSYGLEGYMFTLLNFGALVYLLYHHGMGILVQVGTGYLVLIVLIFQIKSSREQAKQTELLYDENRRYSYQLENSKNRLEHYSQRVEQLSQEEERARISMEIHDTVGHKLTGTLMQLEAALLMLSRDFDKGIATVKAVRDNLKESIDILRSTVKQMKPQQAAVGLRAFKDLLNDFAESSGVKLTFRMEGTAYKLYPSAELVLYKNTREGLTNALRHGRATKVDVVLTYSHKDVVLTIRDNGQGCPEIIKGMGLTGMEERAASLGGRISVRSENGFEVETILPIR